LAGICHLTGEGDPAVGVVGGDGLGDLAVSQLDEGLAFPLLVDLSLSTVRGQLDDVGPQGVRQCTQGSTGVYGGELAVVPHQDQLGPSPIDL